MELTDAVSLIQIPFNHVETWADLGAGSGTFTRALAHLLPAGSTIHAVDQNKSTLALVPNEASNVEIKKWVIDFEKQPLPFGPVDGILIANALHFVKDQPAMLQKTRQQFKNGQGRILLVEYDSDKANPWVPYPVSFKALQELCANADVGNVEKLNERPSVYGRANMYAALIQFAAFSI